MALAAACATLGCTHLQPCPVHGRPATSDARRGQRRKPRNKLYGTAAWRHFRHAYLDQHPVCERPGCKAYATEVHHKIDLRDGGDPLSEDNAEATCKPCHSAETWKRMRLS